MSPQPPVHILDLCCGHQRRHPVVLVSSAKRFYPRKIEYVGVDRLTPDNVHIKKTAAPENLFRESYIQITLDLEDESQIKRFFSRFDAKTFDEIHFHMPGRVRSPAHLALLVRLSQLLKKRGQLYHTFQAKESPLLNFSLETLGAVKGEEPASVYLKNQGRIETAAQSVGLRLEQYGTRSTESPDWMTRPNNCGKNEPEQAKIQKALQDHSSWADKSALHFMTFRKP